jgi:hypothetical protein
MPEENSTKRERFFEYFTAILLGLTTVFGALAAYYNTLWSGSSNEGFVKSVITMSESNAGYLLLFNKETDIKLERISDDIYYAEWKRSIWNKDPDSAYFFDKLHPASREDILKGNTDFPTTAVYKKAQQDTAFLQEIYLSSDSAQKAASVQMETAQKEGKHGDDFTLITVLYTVVLFFAGFASLRSSMRMKMIYLSCATLVFAGTTVLFFILPFPG